MLLLVIGIAIIFAELIIVYTCNSDLLQRKVPVTFVSRDDDNEGQDRDVPDETLQDEDLSNPLTGESSSSILNPCKNPDTNTNSTDPLTNEYVLEIEASIFNSALDARAKTNPVKTYQPGVYTVYKCYGGMANITQTAGSPGGWIDPDNLSVIPSDLQPISTTTPDASAIDVMSLNNDRIGWSYAYPSQFITKYNGYWNYGDNNLYLTFDCGYDYNNLVSTILDVLKTKNVKAVFFVTGAFMDSRPDLVKRIVNEGHIVGNHSLNHLNQPNNLNTSTMVVTEDIRAWEKKHVEIVGTAPSKYFFRPPEGVISERSMALMNQLGYKSLLWGAAYKDWDTANQPTQEEAMAALRKYTSAGDIVLLHGVSQTSTDILSMYIDEYRAIGYGYKLPD